MKNSKNNGLHQDDETVQANEAINDAFNDDGKETKETSSPVPFVSNNTAPLTSDDDRKKK